MPRVKGVKNKAELIKEEWAAYGKAYAEMMAADLLTIKEKSFSNNNVTKSQVDAFLKNPQKNYSKLQNLSRIFMSKSGVYSRPIYYLANIPLFSYVLAPKGEISLYSDEEISASYYKNAIFMQKFNVKSNFKNITEDLLIDGEGYYYKFETKEGMVFKKINNEFCMPSSLDGFGVIRYALDMKAMKDEDPLHYPDEIAKALELFRTNDKNDIFINNQFYPVSNNGVCFKADTSQSGHAIPPFSCVFKSLLDYEQKQELELGKEILANVKMIHNKIPLDKDGKPVIPLDGLRPFVDAYRFNLEKKGLKDNVFCMINPFDSTAINLNTESNSGSNATKKSLESIYSEMGISSMVFNSEKGGAEALKRSVNNDCSMVIKMVIPKFQNYINSELAALSGKVKYACHFLDITTENQEARVKEAQSSMTVGGSRSIYMASIGMDVLFAENLLKMERVRGIDEYLVPQQTSHTLSSSDSSKKVGQPSVEEKQANGEEVSDTADKQAN